MNRVSWMATRALHAALAAGNMAACAPVTEPTPVPATGTAIAASSQPSSAVTPTHAQMATPAEPAPALPTTRPALPATSPSDFCLRPERGDVLFSLLVPKVEDAEQRGAPFLRVYRSTVSPAGAFGPVTAFADLSDRYAVGEAWVERVQCHQDSGRVLLTVGNQSRMSGSDWRADLWMLDAHGRPVADHAIGRDLSPANVAWSPDGDRLLVEGSWMVKPDGPDAGLTGAPVYLYDLDTNKAERLEGVGVETVAGAGGGWLHWSGDGQLAILESIVLSPDAVAARSMQVVDLSSPSPSLRGTRELSGASDTAMAPDGGMIVLTAGFGNTGPKPKPIGVFRWNPAQPADGPQAIGELPVAADVYTSYVGDLTILPADEADTGRVRFVFSAALGDRHQSVYQAATARATAGAAVEDRPLMLADLREGRPATVRQLSPPGVTVESIRVAGRWLGYQTRPTRPPPVMGSPGKFELSAHLRVIPLSAIVNHLGSDGSRGFAALVRFASHSVRGPSECPR